MGVARSRPLARRLKGKRVGVVLSAGYFGFFGHAGFLQALSEAGIVPSCFSGTSAGALVGAMAAAGMSGVDVVERLRRLERKDFWDPDPLGILSGANAHGATGLLAGRKLRRMLERELPARFEDLRHPLVVVAANLTRNAPEAFDRGELPPVVHASCAYPGMFRAAEVGGELYWDGGLLDKAPALALHRAQKPDVVLVHYLPSRSSASGKGPSGWAAWPKAMAAAMAALRQDHFRLQVEQLRQAGVEVVVVENVLPALGPNELASGVEVAELARRKASETLANFFTGSSRGG
ncbi:MAG: patatin-like phospholipase family protein [Myxococcales bacterium]